MATKSSQLNVNGKKVTVESDLNSGSYTVKDSQGRLIGSGSSSSGGSVSFSGGDKDAQKALVGASGRAGQLTQSLNRGLRSISGQIENENRAILNNNADKTQKLNLRDLGYGNKLNIKGVTTPAAPEQDQTPAPPAGGNQGADSPAEPQAVETKPAEVQDLNGGGVRYPLAQIDGSYDFVQFTIVEYVPAGQAGLAAAVAGGGAGRPSNRMSRGNSNGSIILPMPQNISDNNVQGWGSDKMNALQAAGSNIIQGMLGGGVEQATANAARALQANSAQTKQLISATVAQSIVGGGNVLTRTTGAVLNSNLELLFAGPELRNFQFQYTLTPRNKEEAQSCKALIRMFKKGMSAKVRGSSLFLYTPDIFFIDFKHKGQDHPYLNRIKPCALTSFGVNYTADNAYMTYEDGSPVAYQLSMSFQELEPIYDKDYESGEGAKGVGF